MTFDEIQKTIEGMLGVQKELQNSQLRFAESLTELRGSVTELRGSVTELRGSVTELRESVTELKEVSISHERRIAQLIGYSITGETDRLDVIQRLQNLERRLNRLEQDA